MEREILNGAFGVVKPGKWVGDPKANTPVLRIIMDFRCANAVHRMLPGAVDSLVGPAKWQGLSLGPSEVLISSGDDLVACFYLFKIPFSWSRYFAFRKRIKRGVLGLEGDPEGVGLFGQPGAAYGMGSGGYSGPTYTQAAGFAGRGVAG